MTAGLKLVAQAEKLELKLYLLNRPIVRAI
jgi:hypothetical protein